MVWKITTAVQKSTVVGRVPRLLGRWFEMSSPGPDFEKERQLKMRGFAQATAVLPPVGHSHGLARSVGMSLTRATRLRWINIAVVIAFGIILLLGAAWKQRAFRASMSGTEFLDSVNSKYDFGGTENFDEEKVVHKPSAPLTEADIASQSKEYPDIEVPLPERIDLTFFTTARNIGPPQMVAIRSWLGLGASVIVFADNITEVVEVPSTVTESGQDEKDRLKVLQTPFPRSLLGAPRLDLVMEAGELHSTTRWVCMINADIVVPKRFGDLISGPFKRRDLIAIGERLDCRVNPALPRLPKSVRSFEDLEHWSMAPCWPHGSGGKDYYLYRKGFFERRNLVIPPFWIGKFIWDHWLVNSTRNFAVDMTPSLLVGHFSHEYDWNWRAMHTKTKAQVAEAKAIAMKDIKWNARVIDCENKPVFACLAYQSTYDVAFQLCLGDNIQSMPSHPDKLYATAINGLRSQMKPNGQEAASRRIYQPHSLTGSSPSYWTLGIYDWAIKHGCPQQ